MKKIIDVDQATIIRQGPTPINVRWDGHHIRAAAVSLPEGVTFKFDYARPQEFGARVWAETEGPVRWMDETEGWHEIL